MNKDLTIGEPVKVLTAFCLPMFGSIIIQSVVNSFGTNIIAGYSAAIKLNNLVITSFTTLGNGISNYTAQNIGAGKDLRVKLGLTSGLKLIWILCEPIVILYLTASKGLLLLFINSTSTNALHTGCMFMWIVSPFYFVVASKLVSDGVLRGLGSMKKFMTATFTDLILRVLLAIALADILESTGIWCAWPIGWTISTIMSLKFSHDIVKKNKMY